MKFEQFLKMWLKWCNRWSYLPHVYSPVVIIPTHHCEKFLPESYFALILDANPSRPNRTKIEVKPGRLIHKTKRLRSSFCLITEKCRNIKKIPTLKTMLMEISIYAYMYGIYSVDDTNYAQLNINRFRPPAGAGKAGRARSATSVKSTRPVNTVPASCHGSATVRRAGEACYVTKVQICPHLKQVESSTK